MITPSALKRLAQEMRLVPVSVRKTARFLLALSLAGLAPACGNSGEDLGAGPADGPAMNTTDVPGVPPGGSEGGGSGLGGGSGGAPVDGVVPGLGGGAGVGGMPPSGAGGAPPSVDGVPPAMGPSCAPPAANRVAKGPPNIVMIIADDHGYYDSTPYGATKIKTPNLQKLADQGLKFTRAYTATPSCVPSRYSIFSGLMPERHGAVGNHEHDQLKPGLEKIAERIAGAGYQIALKGKVEHATSWKLGSAEAPGDIASFLKNRDKSKPLALFHGFADTHTIWPAADPGRVNPADVVLPPKTFDQPATRLMQSRYVLGVENLDQKVGELLKALNDNLDMSNTLLIYTSDHGQNWTFGKWSLYEAGVKVPMLAVWPGMIDPGTTTPAMVSLMDLMPTFIDLAGGEAPANIDGRSFKDVLLRNTDCHRDKIFTVHKSDASSAVYPSRALRTEHWKYIFNTHPEFFFTTVMESTTNEHGFPNWAEWEKPVGTSQEAAQFMYDFRIRPAEELYLVGSDPFEENNLAYDPRYAAVLAELRAAVKSRMAEVNDEVAVGTNPRLIKDQTVPPAIKILYPNGGESLEPGSEARIVWTAAWKGTQTVKIQYNDGAGWKTVADSTPHSGEFTWTVPGEAAQAVTLRIASSDGRVVDESNKSFVIAAK